MDRDPVPVLERRIAVRYPLEMFGVGRDVRVVFGETRLTERLLSRAVYVSSARLPSGESP